MKLFVFDTQDQLFEKAAATIVNIVNSKPDAVLGLATGGTPVGLYRRLVDLYRDGRVSFKETTTFNLDEYVGLPCSHEQSYLSYMKKHLFQHIDISADRTYIPDGENTDLEAECRCYNRLYQEKMPVDLQLLGIGHNGHIGFNEPGDHLIADTHVVKLQPSTLLANARYFESVEEVPTHALTMGIGMILKARRLLLLVTGKDKADILYRTFHEPITTHCPASLLQVHPNVLVMADREAASRMEQDESVFFVT